jgi:sugar phosphate isomerase/epimerase
VQPLGLQLYTVRSLMADDVAGTLDAVARIGYREVETAGLHGLAPADFRRLLDDHGLRSVSGHVPLDALRTEAERTLADAAVLGQHWVTVPWLAVEDRTPDGYRRVAESLNLAGEAASAAGLRVAYHNHDFEFAELPGAQGRTGWELLLTATDPALVDLQMDIFWTVHAGSDPVAWFERHPGRFPMVHAKDRTATGEMVDVGAGVIDFAAVLAVGRATGLLHILVEHDQPGDPLASVRNSYATLAALEV